MTSFYRKIFIVLAILTLFFIISKGIAYEAMARNSLMQSQILSYYPPTPPPCLPIPLACSNKCGSIAVCASDGCGKQICCAATIACPTPTTIPTPTPNPCTLQPQGDANCDDVINDVDYGIFQSKMKGLNYAVAYYSADFNKDAKVDMLDYEIWRNSFLK